MKCRVFVGLCWASRAQMKTEYTQRFDTMSTRHQKSHGLKSDLQLKRFGFPQDLLRFELCDSRCLIVNYVISRIVWIVWKHRIVLEQHLNIQVKLAKRPFSMWIFNFSIVKVRKSCSGFFFVRPPQLKTLRGNVPTVDDWIVSKKHAKNQRWLVMWSPYIQGRCGS